MEEPKDRLDLAILAGAGLAMGMGLQGSFPTFRKHHDKNVRTGPKPKKRRGGAMADASPSRAKAKAARKARKINRKRGR